MSKYHDHRSDCPFKFAPLDVCDCVEHNMLDHIEQLVATNKSLTKELNICRMAQAVMENGIAEAEKERDDYAFKLADANNTYSEMHVALSEANDKLARAVKALQYYAVEAMPWDADDSLIARIALAEIEGEKE